MKWILIRNDESQYRRQYQDISEIVHLQSGSFPPHSNVIPVLHCWDEEVRDFNVFPDLNFDAEYIGQQAVFSLLPLADCNLEQFLCLRKLSLHEMEVLHLSRDLLQGLRHLDEHYIVHRDAKLDNILLFWDKQKIAQIDKDFEALLFNQVNVSNELNEMILVHLVEYHAIQSFAALNDLEHHISFRDFPLRDQKLCPIERFNHAGALIAQSPEVLAIRQPGNPVNYLKNDAWALGIMIYKMMHHPNSSDATPYSQVNWGAMTDIQIQFKECISVDMLPESFSIEFRELVVNLLHPNYNKRYSLSQAERSIEDLLLK